MGACVLNVHERNGDVLKIATLADFCGTRWQNNAVMIPVPGGKSFLMPVGMVMRLYRRHTGTHAVDISGVPDGLDATASCKGDRVFLHVVNTRRDRSIEATFQIRGRTIASGRVFWHALEPEFEILEYSPEQAAKIKSSKQQFAYLDPGETFAFQLHDGTERQIRLVSVAEEKDPVIGLIRRAQIGLEIDGQPLSLVCAPYVMPTEIAGLRIQADTTSGWVTMPKRVQCSVWDAADPIVDTPSFSFPLPGYRLFSHGLQAYNEPVHLGDRDGDPAGQRFYHNYGVDLAGYEGRQKVVSAIDGVVVQSDPREGNLCIRDDRGLILHYGHLESILTGIRSGTRVRRGEWVGMLGRRGASGNFSHLHVGVYLSEAALADDHPCRNLNLYPWLVAAYQAKRGSELHAMAGPHQTTVVGDPVSLDGRNSIPGRADIASYRWDFDDGTSMAGPVAEKAFENIVLRVCAKTTSGFGGSATGSDARPEGGSVSAEILDRPRNEADGPVPPRPAGLGGLWLAGPAVAGLLLSHRGQGYAPSSRGSAELAEVLASEPNPLQQNRN